MISRTIALLCVLLAAGACQRVGASDSAAASSAGTQSAVERGKYLTTVMGCVDCHNVGSFSPKPDEGHLQGGTIGFEMPGMGVFYPPNLTPDPQAGIGKWSQQDIITALRTGKRPDGRALAPIMPWRNYSILADEDAKAIAAYLKSLPASPHKVPGPSAKDSAPQPYLTVAPPAKPAA
jgi:mono/diheme cytochrome c family protein